MENPEAPEEVKSKLKEQYDQLNPAELKRRIDDKLKFLAKVYETKQVNAFQKIPKNNEPKVTFSFYPTTKLRLPSLVT